MRVFSSAAAFGTAGSLVFGCSVYGSELLQSSDGLIGGGRGGTSSDGGQGPGGSESTNGGSTNGESGNGTGGALVTPEGGAADGGDSAGGAVSAGAAGNAGAAMGGATTGGTATGGSATGGKGGTGGAAGQGGTAGAAGTGGSAGAGGGATVAKCSDHPIPAKATWVASASSESLGTMMESDGLYNPAKHMNDGSFVERWSSGQPQAGNEWIQIDFGKPVSLTGLVLNVRGNQGDYPRMYVVRMSDKAKDFAAPILAMGNGMPTVDDPDNTNIAFSAMATGQYLTVRQTGALAPNENAWWTITELGVVCE